MVLNVNCPFESLVVVIVLLLSVTVIVLLGNVFPLFVTRVNVIGVSSPACGDIVVFPVNFVDIFCTVSVNCAFCEEY